MLGASTSTARAFSDVLRERRAQDRKWGEQNHSPSRWLAVLVEEVGEVANAILEEEKPDRLLTEWVHVAAVAVAAIESLRRSGGAL